MPAGYDGSVKIGVELDSSTIKNSANELARNIEKALSSNDAKIQKMGLGMLKLQDSIQRTSDKMKKLGDTKVPTDKYKGLEATYNRLEAQLEKLGNESIKLQNGAQSGKVVARLKEIETEADKLQTQITYVEEAMNHLKQTGQAFTMGSTTEEFKKLEKTLEYQKVQASIANQEFYRKTTPVQPTIDPQHEQQVRSTSESYKQLKRSASSALATLKKVGSVVSGTVSKGFHALRDKIRGISHSSDDASRNLKKMFRMVLKYVFGLRSVFILYRKIRSATKEAFLAMAGQFPELQAQVDSLKASFTGLKASLATAFQPLISAVIPILTTIINYITAAMNALGNFFAVLTGQKYVYKATKANNGLAKSIGGTGKAAEKANEALAEYDNLLVIQQDKDSGGGGGGGAGGDYAGAWEKVPAESDFAQKLRDAIQSGDWEGLGKEVANKLNTVTKKLDDWIQNKFRPTAKKWASNIARILNGLVDGWDSTLFGTTIGHGLMALADTIATFFETFKWKNLGKKVAGAINGLFTSWEPDTVARLFAGKFNSVIEFVAGLIDKENGINFKLIGSKLGETLKRTIQRIEWKQLGADLSGLATGILEGLASFIKESEVGTTVGNAINEFLSGIDFGQLAKDLSELAINILDALADCLETVDWEAVGQAIADFLKNINWVKFIETLIRVAFNLIKGLGTALLQIATDPEALGSLATGLLAIFGAKWIWSKITGLFATNVASSLTSGLASSGGGNIVGNWLSNIFKSDIGQAGSLGGNIAQGLIAGTVTYAGVGSIAGNINSVLADAIFNDEALTKEYQKFAKNAIGYTKDTIIEVKNAINEESILTGDSTFTNAIKDMASGYDYLETKTQEFHNQQQAIRDEEFEKYLDMIQRRAEAGKEINATDIALLKEYRGIVVATTETARKQTEALEAEAYRQEAIEKHKAGVISDAELATIQSMSDAAIVSRKTMEDTAKHYADIEKSRIQASEESIKKMKEAQQAQKEAAEESRKTFEATASHYAEIEKSKVEDAQKSAERMKAYIEEKRQLEAKEAEESEKRRQDTLTSMESMAKIQRENARQTADSMAASYESGTQKAQTAFSGMSSEYENMTQQICASVATIPGEFERDFNTAYDKATIAFSNTNSFFGKVAEGVKSPFGTMASFFKDTFTTSWNGVVDVFQSNSPQFQSIQDSVSGVFKSSINSMIGGINSSFVTPFQTLSSAFSKLRGFSINGTNPFSSLPFFNIPKIPRLAQGAVLPPNSPFLAMVGDQRQGTNIEAPLDTIVQALQIALQNNGGNNNQPIILTLNGKQVAQAVWDEENKRYKQTGMRYKYS